MPTDNDSWDALPPEARKAWLQGMRFNDDGTVATPPDPDLGGTLVGREHPDFDFVAGKPVAEMHEHDLTDEEGRHIAHVTPATADEVFNVLFAPIDGSDGRSAPVWVRLANGDLLLGVFPEGETYISVSETRGV